MGEGATVSEQIESQDQERMREMVSDGGVLVGINNGRLIVGERENLEKWLATQGLHLIDAKAKRVLDACAAASYRTMALRVCKTDAVGWNIAVGQVSAIAEAELARRGSEPGKGEG
jgi:hypothetical protein